MAPNNKADIRKKIVDLARGFVADSHYLWGTGGNTPDCSDGNEGGGKKRAALTRAFTFDPDEKSRDKVIAVCTAVQSRFDGYNTCAGRCDKYKFTPTQEAFDEYLANCRKGYDECTIPESWVGLGPNKNLHPRKYYFRGGQGKAGKIVWGESCLNRHHFDCVGLVNYCYAHFWYQPGFGLGIPAFRQANQGGVQITSPTDLMDADIIIPTDGDHHIAMIYKDDDGTWKIVQANETTIGLTDTAKFEAGKWDRFRMASAYIKDNAGP